MRPRHEASENLDAGECLELVLVASMRPRHEASENDAVDGLVAQPALASMRPRHEASENSPPSWPLVTKSPLQ